MKVTACPRCASLDIRGATLSDGIAVGGGELTLMVCHDCNFRGSPLVLEDEAAYTTFRAAVAAGRAGGEPAEAEEEPVPEELAGLMALPPPGRPRVSAGIIVALSLPVCVAGTFYLVAAAATLLGGGLPFLSVLLGGFLLALGFAVLRIGLRMWGAEASPGMTQAP